ncbi:hypothetical protein NPIL_629651 [Nephila pilipes]|uniref:Uncharacterized protein n=1 Tax=Nephila pilipes TaxID=299642 RepID=A0A8X6QI00_NEPPI|nr:hypothetical protein NPIL_629651 [Nephila pilipes]
MVVTSDFERGYRLFFFLLSEHFTKQVLSNCGLQPALVIPHRNKNNNLTTLCVPNVSSAPLNIHSNACTLLLL